MTKYVENRNVLYVDDEEGSCAAFTYLMSGEDIIVYTLSDSTLIEEFLRSNGPFAVVLSDQRMPRKDGTEVLREVLNTSPETIRVLVTGYADMEAVKGAINEGGITQYISKPWDCDKVIPLINGLVARYNETVERRLLLSELKLKNENLQIILQGTEGGVVNLLTDLIATLGEDVVAQNIRIKKLGEAVLRMMPELDEKESVDISRALELFNLGLALLPPFVKFRIIKEGLRAIKEIPLAQNHHLLAADLLREIPEFEGAARILLLMRKDFDGIGKPYSDKSRGKSLPLGSRLLRILLDLEEQSTDQFHGRQALEKMLRKGGVYDAELIGKLLGTKPHKQRKRQNTGIPVYELSEARGHVEESMPLTGELIR